MAQCQKQVSLIKLEYYRPLKKLAKTAIILGAFLKLNLYFTSTKLSPLSDDAFERVSDGKLENGIIRPNSS